MEEQEDFDNLYSSKLPNFANNDWRALEGQLERHDLKRQLRKLMWALPAVGGIMLAVSSVLYYQLNRTREQVKTLETRLVNAYQQRRTQSDISPQKIIIHDTIYKQVIIRQVVRDNSSQNPELTNNQNNIYYEKYGNNSTENQIITEREKFVDIHKLSGKSPVLSTTNIGVTNDFSKYKGESFPEDSVVEENHFSLIPKSVSVGIIGGLQLPMGEFFNGSGNTFGGKTVLGYHNKKGQERWGIVLDYQQSNTSFDIDKKEIIDKLGTPPKTNPKPNGSNPRLDKVNVCFSSYKFGLGIRYNLLFNDKIRPYFGTSWNIQIPTDGFGDYEFEDYLKPRKIFQQESTMHMLGLNAGANIFLTKKLVASGELYFQSQFLKEPNPVFNATTVLGAQVGLSYRFGY